MPSRRFDLIAFDWDGTLCDSTAIIVRCIQQAVCDVGGARPGRHAMNLSMTRASRSGWSWCTLCPLSSTSSMRRSW